MNQTKKKTWVVLSAYFVCLAILLSLFFLSGAKYVFSLNGYTNFNLADFNGAIFDDTTLEKIKEGDVSVTALGTNKSDESDFFALKDCYPGMPAREYPFVVANGKDAISFATIDVSFSIKVRTMYNLPLRYTLVYYQQTLVDDELTVEELTFSTAAEPKPLTRNTVLGSGEDALWYEYTFKISPTSETEKTFNLLGGVFSAYNFALRVDWPILAETETKKATDSIDYMEEVELIHLLASLTSENSSTGSDQKIVIHDDASAGILIIDPEHKTESFSKTGALTVYTYEYKADFEAFIKEAGDESITYDYIFKVNNGNNLYKYDENGDRIQTQPTENMFYRLRFLAPYDTQTKDYEYSLVKQPDSINQIGETYTAIPIEYRKYNIDMGSVEYNTYTVITKEKADEEIAQLSTKPDASYNIYVVYAFSTDEKTVNEAVNRLIGKSLSGSSINDRFSEDNYILKVEANDLKYMSLGGVDYKMWILGEAVYQDSIETPVIPTDYMTWPKT